MELEFSLYLDRLAFGFHNPNHAAALVCALLPLCWGWRRATWVGRGLAGAVRGASPDAVADGAHSRGTRVGGVVGAEKGKPNEIQRPKG